MKEYEKLAKIMVNYSCALKKGEKILIDAINIDENFIVCLINEVRKVGGYPFVINDNSLISNTLLKGTTEEEEKLKTKYMLPIMQDMDAYIGMRATENMFDSGDVPSEKVALSGKYFLSPVHFEERVNNTKWLIMRWPTPGFAQSAKLSTKEFERIFFDVCTMDYEKMSKAMDSLVAYMEKTDKVRLCGNGTDITFSIKGQKAIKCCGKRNIPDGEVYCGPLLHSINGTINYNIPTLYNGNSFDGVCLEVVNGKIVKATCQSGSNEALNEILNTDDGARYFGEFAISFNPYITKPMQSILFDEKMAGAIHFTPGNCYKETPNGNSSAIHWDMVLCQREEFGGGEIYFDDQLIRKNGIFVVKELEVLNPQNLM